VAYIRSRSKLKVAGSGNLVGPSGPGDARIAFVGFSPASEEVRTGIPFTGPSGKQLDQCLVSAKSSRLEVYVTNLSFQRLPLQITIEDLEPAYYAECVARLKRELESLPNLTTIVPLGESIYPVAGHRGITRWRGSILPSTLVPGKRVVPSVHPAWIIRGQWTFRPVLTFDIKRAMEESAKPGDQLDLPDVPSVVGPAHAQVMEYLDYYINQDDSGLLAIDIEMHKRAFIACIGFYDGKRPAICIPFVYANGTPIWNTAEEAHIWKGVARLLEKGRIRKCGQNLSFDVMRLLWENAVSISTPWMDTMHAHHCLMPELPHSLAFMNSIYTRLPYYKDDGKTWDPKVGANQLWLYNCKDVWATYHVALALEADLRKNNLWDAYDTCYRKRFRVAMRMEYEGIRVDSTKWAELSTELSTDIDAKQTELDSLVGFKLNVSSPKQMQDYLYNIRKYAPIKKRKTGAITTDVEALRTLASRHRDPVIPKIIELRQQLDLKGDIFDQKISADSRIRCHYSQTGTDTGGRWSSSASVTGSGTNLQNIPRKGPSRKLFLPDDGHIFVAADQVQAEVMAVAWMGPVPGLQRFFREGKDIHLEVALLIAQTVKAFNFNTGGLFMDIAKITDKSEERYVAKRTVHAGNYGIGKKKYASVAGIPTELAEALLAIYHLQLFPEIRSLYQKGIENDLRTTRTLWVPGYNTRRIFLDYWDDAGELLRAAYAHKPQALIGHITGDIMDRVEDTLLERGVAIRMQIHDEIIVSTPPELVEWVCETLDTAAKAIKIPLPGGVLNIPLSFKKGPSYGELVDFKPGG
jgi:uracil-DNA glycosylase family 4